MTVSRAEALLQGLRNRIQTAHMDRLRRSLHSEIIFERKDHGEFDIIVTPLRPPGAPPYCKSFTAQLVFGSTIHLSPAAWTIQKKACDYVDDLIREVLRHRGVM